MELSHLLFNLTDQSLPITLLLISDCLINVCFFADVVLESLQWECSCPDGQLN